MRSLAVLGACCAMLISCPALARQAAQDPPPASQGPQAAPEPQAVAEPAAPDPQEERYMQLVGEAQAAMLRGGYAEALARLGEARALAETHFGRGDPATLNVVFAEGQLFLAWGRLAEAELRFRDAIAQLELVTEPVPPLARFLMNTTLAVLYQSQGRFPEAEALFTSILEEGERLSRAQPPDPEAPAILVTARGNLGMMYTAQGRYAEAESVLRQALRDNEAVPADAGQTGRLLVIANLANVYFYQHRYSLAEPLYREVIAAGGPLGAYGAYGERGANLSRNNLAQLYVAQGRYAEAEPLLLQLRATHEALGADLPETILAVGNLADLYRRQGRFAEAEPLLVRALDSSARMLGEGHLITANVAANLTLLRLASPGAAATAIDSARRFITVLRSLRATDPSQTSGKAQRDVELGARAQGYSLLADADWAAAAARPAERNALTAEAFTALQEATAGTAGRAVVQTAVRRLADEAGAALGVLVREREGLNDRWTANSAEYSAALANSGPEVEALKQELRAARARIEARMAEIDAVLRREFLPYFALVRPEPLDVAAAQALLAPDEAILMVVPTEFGTHVLGVSSTAIHWVRSPWTRDRVNAAVRPILTASGASLGDSPGQAEGGARTFPRQTAHALYREIVAPVAAVLAGKRHVFIVAGGSLSSLPFGILVTEAPQGDDRDPQRLRETRWFAEAHALVQIPSIQSLQLLRRPGGAPARAPAAGAGFVGFGNPALTGAAVQRGRDYSGPGMDRSALFRPGRAPDGTALLDIAQLGRLARLPGTAIELEYIRASLGAPHSALFLAERATERNVRSTDLSGVRILAFATHGLLAGMVRETGEPGLVFTPPATASEADDGYLTAAEVSALRLDADWVILSACNTAAGDGSEGAPGLSGLARAFFYAGARNLLASHWPVRDDVAAQITVRTIQIQRAEPALSRAEAFQRAMREVRLDRAHDAAGDSWAHPNAWAPFILIGDGAR